MKAPAALGVLFLGWVWAGPGASILRRVATTCGALLIAACTFLGITQLAGLGWGWIGNSTAADQSFTFVTPIGGVARVVSALAHLANIDVTAIGVRNVLAVFGLLVAAAIGTWLLLRSPKDGVTRNLGLTLLVLAILSPILWAWYVTWGVLVLAPVATGRLRTAIIAIATIETFVGLASVRGIVDSFGPNGLLSDIVLIAALIAISLVPLRKVQLRRRDQQAGPTTTPPALAKVPA